jgi:hypothetical protein
VFTVYVYCVQCTLFPPVAETCARLVGNFCQYLTTVMSGANSLVSVTVFYFTASWGGGREEELGKSVSIALHSLTLPGPGGESREGGCMPPWMRSG